eukprot:scaffold37298_cov43-Phaeocystis_antarctica.AAC.2
MDIYSHVTSPRPSPPHHSQPSPSPLHPHPLTLTPLRRSCRRSTPRPRCTTRRTPSASETSCPRCYTYYDSTYYDQLPEVERSREDRLLLPTSAGRRAAARGDLHADLKPRPNLTLTPTPTGPDPSPDPNSDPTPGPLRAARPH